MYDPHLFVGTARFAHQPDDLNGFVDGSVVKLYAGR